MCIKKKLVTIIPILFGITSIYGQQGHTEICINFRVNSHTIDSTYMNNANRLGEIDSVIRQLRRDSTLQITQVTFCGLASPEGHSQINRRLAKLRMESLEAYVRSHIFLPEGIIVRHDDHYIPWDYLIREVESSDLSNKNTILSILRGPSTYVPYSEGTSIDSRIPALQKLDGGRVWRTLFNRYFAKMRNACAVLFTVKEEPRSIATPAPEPVNADTAVTVKVLAPELVMESVPVYTLQPEEWMRQLHIKTNVIGLGMAIANIAAEVDLAKHWSFTLPVYYSAWDYFKSTIKFRTFAVQPEFRYWLSEENDGFFGGVHFGLAYYNFAFDGDYRYQDHNRETPAIGGGVSIGYRLPISKNNRWRVEFSLGAGVYSRHYDKFHNTPHTKDGLMIESIKKTYWGFDQAAVSFSYSFDLKKKGGKR